VQLSPETCNTFAKAKKFAQQSLKSKSELGKLQAKFYRKKKQTDYDSQNSFKNYI